MRNLKDLQKSIENRQVESGIITTVQRCKELDEDVVKINLGSVEGIIPRSEFDINPVTGTLVKYIGRKVFFVIKEFDPIEKKVYCSRREAQEIMREQTLKKLQAGQKLEGQIVKMLPFGALVDVEGLTCLLKNVDFSEDHTAVSEAHKVNDKIAVILSRVSEEGKVDIKVPVKYKNPNVVDISGYERDQVILGTIRNVKPWGVFVRLNDEIDALCGIPLDDDVESGMQVAFRVTSVNQENGRIRGKIINIF